MDGALKDLPDEGANLDWVKRQANELKDKYKLFDCEDYAKTIRTKMPNMQWAALKKLEEWGPPERVKATSEGYSCYTKEDGMKALEDLMESVDGFRESLISDLVVAVDKDDGPWDDGTDGENDNMWRRGKQLRWSQSIPTCPFILSSN